MTSMAAKRMTIARGFARHMAGTDPRTQIPPAGLIAFPKRWHPPFIFEPDDIDALVTAAQGLRWPLPAATHATLIGLLAVTGLRVGEAIRLDRADIDWQDATLLIRESKFGKSRLVPVLPSTLTALDHYRRIREQKCPRPNTPAFFVSIRGARMVYQCVHDVFRNLCGNTGTGAQAARPPRIHDLRHTFAVRTLLGWYQAATMSKRSSRRCRPTWATVIRARRIGTCRSTGTAGAGGPAAGVVAGRTATMSPVAPTLQGFFTERLVKHRHVSPRTITSYRDSLKLLFLFVQQQTGKLPATLDWNDLDVDTIAAFLEHLETTRATIRGPAICG